MKLGACLDLASCQADIVDYGGAVGVWDASAGTFTVSIEAAQNNPGCGGSNTSQQWSRLTLKLNGPGQLGIAISGTGETHDENFEQATAHLDGAEVARSASVGGDMSDCGGAPLVEAVNNSPLAVCACAELELKWDTIDSLWHGAWTCTFTLSVL